LTPSGSVVQEDRYPCSSPRARAIGRYVGIVDGPRAGPSYDSVKPVDRVVGGEEHFATMRFEAAADSEPPLRGLDLDRLLAAVARDFGFSATDLEGPKRGGHVAADFAGRSASA
jgi:hypothetical protein